MSEKIILEMLLLLDIMLHDSHASTMDRCWNVWTCKYSVGSFSIPSLRGHQVKGNCTLVHVHLPYLHSSLTLSTKCQQKKNNNTITTTNTTVKPQNLFMPILKLLVNWPFITQYVRCTYKAYVDYTNTSITKSKISFWFSMIFNLSSAIILLHR